VYLLNVTGTGSPTVEIDGGDSGGELSNIRDKTESPAFVMTGCTYSQHAVARMMTRMRNLDEVTKVTLAKSERKEDTVGTVGGGGTGVSETDSKTPKDVQDCIGSSRVTKFDLLVEFGGSKAEAEAAAAALPAGAAVPAATPVTPGAPE
jgi:hypothetical protein